jgi:PQQ-dependent catabolism-associated CXXCW motif protein
MIRAGVLAVALMLAVGTVVPAASPAAVAEPAGLWTGPMGGETPATLHGATVLDLPSLDRLLEEPPAPGKPVLLDLSQSTRRPDGLAADRPWLPVHRSLPGSVWLPGAGAADLGPGEAVFARRAAELTEGDKTRPIVTFCQPHCWASWNAAKRLVGLGYTRIYWFPPGINGWQNGHDTVVTTPDPGWTARRTSVGD